MAHCSRLSSVQSSWRFVTAVSGGLPAQRFPKHAELSWPVEATQALMDSLLQPRSRSLMGLSALVMSLIASAVAGVMVRVKAMAAWMNAETLIVN